MAGGEPTLLPRQFFSDVLRQQRRLRRGGLRIHHSIQTNGTRLDDEWYAFLKKQKLLADLSLDGPPALHDVYRRDQRGRPSAASVVAAAERMRRFGIPFNVLCCVHAANVDHPHSVYTVLRDEIRATHIQFIPIVEKTSSGVSERSVPPAQFGAFLNTVFDHWIRTNVGRVFIQLFDVALATWAGRPIPLCVFAPTCGTALALEHNGDLYSCDHFVEPELPVVLFAHRRTDEGHDTTGQPRKARSIDHGTRHPNLTAGAAVAHSSGVAETHRGNVRRMRIGRFLLLTIAQLVGVGLGGPLLSACSDSASGPARIVLQFAFRATQWETDQVRIGVVPASTPVLDESTDVCDAFRQRALTMHSVGTAFTSTMDLDLPLSTQKTPFLDVPTETTDLFFLAEAYDQPQTTLLAAACTPLEKRRPPGSEVLLYFWGCPNTITGPQACQADYCACGLGRFCDENICTKATCADLACGDSHRVCDENGDYPICGACEDGYVEDSVGKCGPCQQSTECPSGQYCSGASHLCQKDCDEQTPCGNEAWCSPYGRCHQRAPAGNVCAAAVLEGPLPAPAVVFLVDGSAAMNADFDGVSRWDAVAETLVNPTTGVVSTRETEYQFGVSVFFGEPFICPQTATVDPRLNNQAEIQSLLYGILVPNSDSVVDEPLLDLGADLSSCVYCATCPDCAGCPNCPAAMSRYAILIHAAYPQRCGLLELDRGGATATHAAGETWARGINVFDLCLNDSVPDGLLQDIVNAGAGCTILPPYHDVLNCDWGTCPNAGCAGSELACFQLLNDYTGDGDSHTVVQCASPMAFPYARPSTRTSLASNLETIMDQIPRCVVHVTFADNHWPNQGTVFVDGDEVPLASPTNGWYLTFRNQVGFDGAICDQLSDGQDHLIVVQFDSCF